MITLTRITQPSDPLLGRLMPLYTEAFPPEERRQAAQLEKLLHTEQAMFLMRWNVKVNWPACSSIGISVVFITWNIWLYLPKCAIKR